MSQLENEDPKLKIRNEIFQLKNRRTKIIYLRKQENEKDILAKYLMYCV